MTKSQIIRELTIELAEKCKRVRELDTVCNKAVQKTIELDEEIERMKTETIRFYEQHGLPVSLLCYIKKALGIIK